MSKPGILTCVIIGSGTLPVRCAEILIDGGHKVSCLVSSDEAVISFASETGITLLPPGRDLGERLSGRSFDYLFSINNGYILREDVLSLPRKLAINYHDALLPAYAGMHATSWAILNGETLHGISWHEIVDEIDAGDILKQKEVAIDPEDTAFTLNAKCYEAAIEAFGELAAELSQGTEKKTPQDLSKRTYYALHKRPENGCVVSWDMTAEEIARLARALDFGPIENPLGTPKIFTGAGFVSFTKAESSESAEDAAPGTILNTENGHLRVRTSDGALVLRDVMTLEGSPIEPGLFPEFGFQNRIQLPDPERDAIARIGEIAGELAGFERRWTARLADIRPAEIPFKHSGAGNKESCIERISIPVPRALKDDERGESRVIAAIAALFLRLGGSETIDIAFSREDSDETARLGFFAPTVPLRASSALKSPFSQLLLSTEKQLSGIAKRKTFPLDLWYRDPELRGRYKGKPVTLPVGIRLGNATDEQELCGAGLVFEIDGELSELTLAYDSSSLEADSARQLASHLKRLIEHAADSPETAIADLSIISEEESEALLLKSRGPERDYPKKILIHELFEKRVRKSPDAAAVRFEGTEISYRELNEQANRLARFLRANGVAEEALVGISLRRSPRTIVSILAVLKAGGAYVPLDPAYPEERISYILEDSAAVTVITEDEFAEKFEVSGARVLNLDREAAKIRTADPHDLEIEAGPDRAAYVIYTSGSTGKPKGVTVEHRSLVNHCLAVTEIYGITAADRVLQFSSFSFDVAAEETFPSLCAGACLVQLSDTMRADLAGFSGFLKDEALSVVNLPASYWHSWVGSLTGGESEWPVSVRTVITGSERVFADDYNSWRELAGPEVKWFNAYGLTETTVTNLIFDSSSLGYEAPIASVPIGRPVFNTSAYVLDASMKPVPPGIPGELYIGGDCVARGYLGREELNDEKFVRDPFSVEPDARLYRSGDLVRMKADGQIEYIDRVDNQVKISGYRIELGEIEAALQQHPLVEDSAVIPRSIEGGSPRLVSYVVPSPLLKTDTEERIELWPSVGEYPVYDELIYYSLSTDKHRTDIYRAAINRTVKDKVVVEIGTGKDAILARMCADAGARKVYAIEGDENAYEGARKLVADLGLSDVIELIRGYSTEIDLPEMADVIVSEIIGTIGGSEGAAAILNDARRFLKEGGKMIPSRCRTFVSAVELPPALLNSPHFSKESWNYAEQVFDAVGNEFDIRICAKGLEEDSLLTNAAVFEDLRFDQAPETDFECEIHLGVKSEGTIHGFLLWLELDTAEGLSLDNLRSQSSWIPVYFHISDEGIEVKTGDSINAVAEGNLSENGLNPDYRLRGTVNRDGRKPVEFEHFSPHLGDSSRNSEFYEKLFLSKHAEIEDEPSKAITGSRLRAFLSKILPGHMVPTVYVKIDELPLTPSGKVDRKALPEPVLKKAGSGGSDQQARDDYEKKLVKIWQDVLEEESIGTNDNFFELGGNSLQAVRMFAEVENTFGKNIPLATLFDADTVEKLADILRQEGWEAPESCLVPIQPEGTRPVFFCFHARGGNVLFYRDLAKRLGKDQPFYGIQARRLGGRQVGHATVEEMADYYIDEIRTVQPRGPYYLGGSSFGGLTAFEVAKRLSAQGEEIALVALLDTGTPDYPTCLPTSGLKSRLLRLSRRLEHQKDTLRLLDTKGKLDYFGEKLYKVRLRYWRLINNTYKKAVRGFYEKYQADKKLPKNYVQIEDQIGRAGKIYKPGEYSGDVVLFRATKQPLGIEPDETLGWRKHVLGGLEILDVPGHHGSIVKEPFVKVLAEKLGAQIEEAESRNPRIMKNVAG